MIFFHCRVCRALNISTSIPYGSLASCGKCQAVVIVHDNCRPVEAAPVTCSHCGGRSIGEQWADGCHGYYCEDCQAEREVA